MVTYPKDWTEKTFEKKVFVQLKTRLKDFE